jgi:hypothetical protein
VSVGGPVRRIPCALGRRSRTTGRVLLALHGALLWVLGCSFVPPLPPPKLDARGAGADWAVQRIASPQIGESSGLVKSRTHPGVFWTHNDSGDEPRIFAITARGELIREIPVEGARNVDWEDIAIDDAGHLYLADVGNNLNRRRHLKVYRVPEPDPFDPGSVARADRVLPFRYADQRGFPQWRRLDFDAEALFWMEGALYLLTKHHSDRASTLYRLDPRPEPSGGEVALEPLARLSLGGGRVFGIDPLGGVTGADLHPDGRRLAVLSYRALLVFERVDGAPAFRPLHRIALDPRRTRLAESVAWDGDALIFGNEQRSLFRIPDPLDPSLAHYP